MFDAGFLEMLVIAVIALLVVGPERLPGLARKAGSVIGKVKAFVTTTKADIERELNTQEVRETLARQEEELRNLRVMMDDKKEAMTNSVKEIADDVKSNPLNKNQQKHDK